MKKHFLVTVELPDWADDPARLEIVRDEIEQFAGASAALHMRATHVTATCELLTDKLGALGRVNLIYQ